MSGIQTRREGRVLHIELDRPDRANALSADTVESLLAVLAPSATLDVELAVFSGRGRGFCAGFDLQDLEQTTDAELMWRMVRVELLLQAVYHAPFVTLAFAHGHAIGAGADLFCACSVRVAASDTMFRMPGLKFGIALGTRRLAHRIGADQARRFLLAGRSIDAARAQAIGLATDLRPVAEWPQAREEAATLASALPTDSVERLSQLAAHRAGYPRHRSGCAGAISREAWTSRPDRRLSAERDAQIAIVCDAGVRRRRR